VAHMKLAASRAFWLVGYHAQSHEMLFDAHARGFVAFGGEPLGAQIVMWWNFIGRSHDEVIAFRAAWQGEVIAGGDPFGRFGSVDGYGGA
ncbi:pirin-like C-terminal cupin domain-containing protein, partial [Brevibacillus sp. SIMBA_076]|uniref:pirin-like C-terminal cupin domain-containing protein n=1 Tax=Brevibacillus sp. SIMBA_076 TaxID=3085814 RepID=UPI00397DCBB1